MRILTFVFILFFALASVHEAQSQRLKNLGVKKAKEALEKKLKGEEEEKNDGKKEGEGEKSDKSLNKRMTDAEVMSTLDAARDSYNQKEYGSARYSIESALVEIELKLGHKVLGEMPTQVNGQSYDPEKDNVISTGMGFAGLEIMRVYPSDNGDIEAAISNNATMLMPYNMALSNPSMTQQSEDMKAVTVNGKRGIMELDKDDDNFKVIIPFGQSSAFILICDTCATESETITSAEQFDLSKYLKILGETDVQLEK